jgi:GTPase-activating protein SAC7
VPIVVAKAGVFLKEKASDVEDIFALNGNPARMMRLQQVFNGPDRFGKDHDWTGRTVYDAAGLMLRYLKSRPEPVIPYQHYQDFTASFRPYIDKDDIANAVDPVTAIPALQRCVTDLPPLNRLVLLYLLDLLAVFASKSAVNKMTSRRLVGVFQPALLSRLPAEMDADEYHLAAHTMVFVIENLSRGRGQAGQIWRLGICENSQF